MPEQLKEYKLSKLGNIIIYVFLLIAACYSCQNTRIAEVVSFIEVVIVVILSVTRRLDSAIIIHNVFLACSIEVSTFVYSDYTMMYSYAYLPYVHRYGPLFIEIGLLVLLLIQQNCRIMITRTSETKGWMGRFVRYITFLILIGFLVSIIMLAFNDNRINSLSWYGDSYLREMTYWLILIIDIWLIYNRFTNSPSFPETLKNSLLTLFIAIPFASILSILLGFHGTYSYHITVLLMPLVSFYAIGIAVFPSYKEYRSLLFYICAGIMLGAQLIMTTPLLGKWVLFIIAIVVVILWNNLSRKKFFRFLGIAIILVIAFVYIGNTILEHNEILRYKFEQVMGSLSLGGSWLNNMSASPSIRIEEFINAGVEYVHKPWLFLFGKGIGGTTAHWLRWNNWNIASAFTMEEFSSGVFIGMHESVNILFLKYGLVGIIFFIWMVVKCIKNISKSPWIFLGLFWFVFFINAYISLYVMVPVLMLGMYESEKDLG